MKKVFLFLISLCFLSLAQAQPTVIADGKKITVSNLTAGGLAEAIQPYLGAIEHLIITGEIDARDFKTIVTEIGKVNNLVNLDLGGITKIAGYSGTEGPRSGDHVYPENELPQYGLFNNIVGRGLTTLALPSNAGITSIGVNALRRLDRLTNGELTLPSGVTSIGAQAFHSSSSITKINLPTNVTFIGEEAFYGMTKLTEFTWPAGVKEIPKNAFYNSRLTKFAVPATVEYIGESAFLSNPLTAGFTFAPRTTTLSIHGTGTFNGTQISGLEFPENSQIVGTKDQTPDGVLLNTFQSGSTTVINLPPNVTVLNGTFQNNTGITEFDVPEGVEEIGQSAFYGARNLERVTLPNTVRKIGTSAFAALDISLTKLSSVTLGNSVTEIGSLAFEFTNITELELPATVINLGNNALRRMTKLQTLKVHNPEPIQLSESHINVFGNIKRGDVEGAATLYVPAGSKAKYEAAYLWKDFAPNIVEFVSKQPQTIEGFADRLASEGDEIEFPTNTDQGQPVTYTIEEGKDDVATLNGNKLTVTGAGEVQITATADGNDQYDAFSKTITIATSFDYSWLLAPAIAVEGDIARVVGPEEAVAAFTKFYIGNDPVVDFNNENGANLTGVPVGTVTLKATNNDGSQVIRLVISK